MNTLTPTAPSVIALVALACGAALVLLLSARRPCVDAGAAFGGGHLGALALVALAVAAAALWHAEPTPSPLEAVGAAARGMPLATSQAVAIDGIGKVFGLTVLAGSAVSVALAVAYLQAHALAIGEYVALLLLSTIGACIVAMAQDLLALFFGIELMSMAAYVLAGYRRAEVTSQEAALKYYLFGAFASALMIFGMALTWGEAGRVLGEPTFALVGIGAAMRSGTMAPLGWVGVGLLSVGLLFKVGAVPFHGWTADVYEGAPLPSTAFFSTVVKTASFAGLLRLVDATWLQLQGLRAANLLAILALCSVVVGNLMALRQVRVKRLMAYSSVAHAGYALLGLMAHAERSPQGVAAAAFYLASYTAFSLGSFAALQAVIRPGPTAHDPSLEDLAGAGRNRPFVGALAAMFLFALAGMPPTSGFSAKLSLFSTSIASGHPVVASAAALASIVGAYAYLRVLAALFLREPNQQAQVATPPSAYGWLMATLTVCALWTLGWGVSFATPLGWMGELLR